MTEKTIARFLRRRSTPVPDSTPKSHSDSESDSGPSTPNGEVDFINLAWLAFNKENPGRDPDAEPELSPEDLQDNALKALQGDYALKALWGGSKSRSHPYRPGSQQQWRSRRRSRLLSEQPAERFISNSDIADFKKRQQERLEEKRQQLMRQRQQEAAAKSTDDPAASATSTAQSRVAIPEV